MPMLCIQYMYDVLEMLILSVYLLANTLGSLFIVATVFGWNWSSGNEHSKRVNLRIHST